MSNSSEKASAVMPAHTYNQPINLLSFVAAENENFMVALVNDREELNLLTHLQALYAAAMSHQSVGSDRIVVFQLMMLVHYHFLFSSACFMRCHMSDAFNSARIAIDAALVAAKIIKEPASQFAYIDRKHPFDKLIRNYRNQIKNKEELPHRMIEQLINLHDMCSQSSSHADIQTFAHRLDFVGGENPQTPSLMRMAYFQFPDTKESRKYHFLGLIHTFGMTLDVFADFLVNEQKFLPEEWHLELQSLGQELERRQALLKPIVDEQLKNEREALDLGATSK